MSVEAWGPVAAHALIAAFCYGRLFERVANLTRRIEALERWRERLVP